MVVGKYIEDVEHFLVTCMNSSGRGRGCWKGIEGAAVGD